MNSTRTRAALAGCFLAVAALAAAGLLTGSFPLSFSEILRDPGGLSARVFWQPPAPHPHEPRGRLGAGHGGGRVSNGVRESPGLPGPHRRVQRGEPRRGGGHRAGRGRAALGDAVFLRLRHGRPGGGAGAGERGAPRPHRQLPAGGGHRGLPGRGGADGAQDPGGPGGPAGGHRKLDHGQPFRHHGPKDRPARPAGGGVRRPAVAGAKAHFDAQPGGEHRPQPRP